MSEYPKASEVARYQARNGSTVTNMRHELLNLQGRLPQLLPYLDGSRDHVALQDVLALRLSSGQASLPETGSSEEEEQAELSPEEMLQSSLQSLANGALLVG